MLFEFFIAHILTCTDYEKSRFLLNFCCANVCELKFCHLLHRFIMQFNVPLLILKIGVSEEQVVILPFAHNSFLLT